MFQMLQILTSYKLRLVGEKTKRRSQSTVRSSSKRPSEAIDAVPDSIDGYSENCISSVALLGENKKLSVILSRQKEEG